MMTYSMCLCVSDWMFVCVRITCVHYACSITLYLLTCLLTHSPTYPLTHSHTHSLTHSLTLLCSQLVLILWSAIISVNQLNLVTTMMELLVTIASSRNIISEALSSLSVLLKQYFLSSGLEGQRVRPEDRPVKNPWSVLDPHSPTKESNHSEKVNNT